MKNNVLQTKSYAFAIDIVKAYKQIVQNKKEFVLSKQLLRSGTSVGANIEEALGAQSRRDFYAKLTISYKEARETRFWLQLLYDSDYLDKDFYSLLNSKINELLKIIGSIQLTMKSTKDNS